MLFKALYRNPPFLIVLSIILLLCAVIPLVLADGIPIEAASIPLYTLGSIFHGSFWYLLLIGLLLHFICIALLISIAAKLKLLEQPHFQIILIYLFLLNVLKLHIFFSPLLLAMALILLSFNYLLQYQVQHSIHAPLLISNGLLVLAFLLFPPTCIFIIPAFLALIVFRPFSFREVIIFLIGLLLPFLYFFGLLYLTDNVSSIPSVEQMNYRTISVSYTDFFQKIGLTLYGAVFFLSFFNIFSNSFKMAVRVRNFYKVWAFFAAAALAILVFEGVDLGMAFTGAIPFLALALCYLLSKMKRAWFLEVPMLLLLLLSFIWEFIA